MTPKRILYRIIQIITVLFGISFMTFLLMYIAPGNPAQSILLASGIMPTEEKVQDLMDILGLNAPFMTQYIGWLENILRGNMGISYSLNKPVADLLLVRLWPTLRLTIFSMILMTAIAVPLGMLSAVYKDTWIDYIIRGYTFLGVSVPNFWVGLLIMLVFSVYLGILPVICSGGDFLSMIGPSLTLAFAMSAKYTRQVRTVVLEELSQDYVIGARARGIKESRILWCNVFPNSLLPLITMFGISVGSLLGGTAVVEVIFSYPGLGNLAVSAITSNDYTLIQGYVLWTALIYMVINLLVDISYNFIDPRMRLKR